MRNAALIPLLTVGLGACGSKAPAKREGTGGVVGAGGAISTGGTQGAGGATSSGVPSTGGRSGNGGTVGTDGATTSGGMPTSGGAGGISGSGGVKSAGGVPSAGGVNSAGGVASGGGRTSTGGAVGDASPDAGRDATQDHFVPLLDAADAKSAKCPSSSTLTVGDNRATLQHGGRSRSYVVYLPSSVKAGTAVPLVLDFHGNGGSSTQEESSSGWKKKADQAGFIVIYPDGVGKAWNVGNCCGEALSGKVDDVGFTRAVIEAVSQAACIDPKRIYATGMSNGAGFTHRLACEAADVIAAIAAASADLVTDPCTPARPISELSVRGLTDTMVAYAGGNTGSTGWYSPGAKGTLDLWKKIDQCTGSVETSRQYCETYSRCSASVEITLCSLPNTGHDTYNNAVALSVPDVAWDMFQRQPMPW
jgi:polyhydroxybutyrate depolymerase